MKVTLILPSQKSVHSVFYENYSNLCNALKELSVDCDIIEVRLTGNAKFPFGSVREIGIGELYDVLKSENGTDAFFITVDDYDMMRWLEKQETFRNMIIWAHYFYGHRYIFKSYRLRREPLTLTVREKVKSVISGYVPSNLAIFQSSFYWKALKRYPVFSQSIWTSLLLERVFDIPVLGIVLTPVDTRLFSFNLSNEREGILVFLGDASDTDLAALHRVLKLVDESCRGSIDYFGNEETGKMFENTYGIRMNFIGKVSREDLVKQYSSHFITIAPVFNGNFEMVPIQSLLSGTPVITYTQPFMEVTGNDIMIANIHNRIEILEKISIWKNLDVRIRERMRSVILEKMGEKRVAGDLLHAMSGLNVDQ